MKNSRSLLHSYRASNIFILFVICAAVFTDIFLYGVLVPVIPFALTQRVGIAPDQIARWNGILLALFNLGLCLGSPVFGFLADHVSSRRLPFLAGLLALLGATLLLCFSRTMALFAVGRTLQGVSAAICWSVGLSMLADTMGGRMGWAAGWVNWAMNAGFLLSPILGGLAYEKAGYYSVFYMAFGLLVGDICLRLAMVEKKDSRSRQSMKSSEGDGARVPEMAESGCLANDQDEPRTIPGGGGIRSSSGSMSATVEPSVALSANNLRPTMKSPYYSLITSGRVLAALFGCMMQSASKYAFFAVVPLFVQTKFHWDSLAAGAIFLCVLLPGFLSPLVGTLCDKYGTKWMSTSGFLVSVPLFVCLRFVKENTTSQKVLFGALLALMGVALALSSTPLMAEISYVIDDMEKEQPGIWGKKGVYGAGFGLFTTAFALGGVVGSFMGGYLYQGPGWETFGWAFAIWCAGGATICALFVGSGRIFL